MHTFAALVITMKKESCLKEKKNTKIYLRVSPAPGILAYGLIHLVGHQHACVLWNKPMKSVGSRNTNLAMAYNFILQSNGPLLHIATGVLQNGLRIHHNETEGLWTLGNIGSSSFIEPFCSHKNWSAPSLWECSSQHHLKTPSPSTDDAGTKAEGC